MQYSNEWARTLFSGGTLRSVKKKPGREEAYVINYAFYMWICLYIYSAFFSVELP